MNTVGYINVRHLGRHLVLWLVPRVRRRRRQPPHLVVHPRPGRRRKHHLQRLRRPPYRMARRRARSVHPFSYTEPRSERTGSEPARTAQLDRHALLQHPAPLEPPGHDLLSGLEPILQSAREDPGQCAGRDADGGFCWVRPDAEGVEGHEE